MLTAPLDLSVAAHPAHGLIIGIVRLAWSSAVGPRRRIIVLRRRRLAERLVRSLLVEGGAECIEAPLLLAQRCRRRARGVLLEREVHALVPAILLRTAWLDPLRQHAGLDQPPPEPRQPARRHTGERRAVIGAHYPWQAELKERRLKDRPHLLAVDPLQRLQSQDIA